MVHECRTDAAETAHTELRFRILGKHQQRPKVIRSESRVGKRCFWLCLEAPATLENSANAFGFCLKMNRRLPYYPYNFARLLSLPLPTTPNRQFNQWTIESIKLPQPTRKNCRACVSG